MNFKVVGYLQNFEPIFSS